jgi:carboxyl-terminal processing protease
MLALIMLALYAGITLGKVFSVPIILKPDQSNLSTVIDYISRLYVDSIDSEEIIVDILKELDPHSVYIPASELQKSNEHLEGNFDGIGVTFRMLNDTVYVINVIPDGPSNRAGVLAGDRIITVNDSVIAGKKVAEEAIKSLLRGKSGSNVQIKVLRNRSTDLIPIDITRGKVLLKSIDAAYMIAPNIGYIRMTGFAQSTHSEFINTVDQLHSEGMTGMILDLRNNTGGLLEQAIRITSELFSDKRLIVYTEGRTSPRRNEYSGGNGKCGSDSLIVLINENSASASEILAGAVQDNDRGIIVGRRSFGKGLVQQMIMLSDGAGLRLTTARYYTPSGRSIQRHYDHGALGYVEYYMDLDQRWANGEYESADSVKLVDTTKYYTSKNRVVYGGGGITPDVFVSLDTSGMSVNWKIGSKMLSDYALIFGDRYRNELNAISSIEQLELFFEKHNPYSGFDNYLKGKGIYSMGKNGSEARDYLEKSLKAYISQITPLSDLGSTFMINKSDKTVQKALEIITVQQ